jgi:hypothetical protein
LLVLPPDTAPTEALVSAAASALAAPSAAPPPAPWTAEPGWASSHVLAKLRELEIRPMTLAQMDAHVERLNRLWERCYTTGIALLSVLCATMIIFTATGVWTPWVTIPAAALSGIAFVVLVWGTTYFHQWHKLVWYPHAWRSSKGMPRRLQGLALRMEEVFGEGNVLMLRSTVDPILYVEGEDGERIGVASWLRGHVFYDGSTA